MNSVSRNFLTLLLPVAFSIFNYQFLKFATDGGPTQLKLSQAISGVIIAFVLAYASGAMKLLRMFNRTELKEHDATGWFGSLLAFTWMAAWLAALLFLPAGGLLNVLCIGLFLKLVWSAVSNGLSPFKAQTVNLRTCMALTFVALVTIMMLAFKTHSFRASRLLADFSGPLDLGGRHHMHGQLLKALTHMQLFGASDTAHLVDLERVHGSELLRLAAHVGAFPAALLTVTVVAGLMWLYRWLAKAPVGELLTPGLRRFGLTLVAMHVVATLMSILWNFGVTRQQFGGSIPLLTWQTAWWSLNIAALGVLLMAWRQHLVTPSSQTVRKRSRLARIGALGTILVATLSITAIADDIQLGYQNTYPTLSQQAKRSDILDRNGKKIAETTKAFDLWVIPHDFWGTSLVNPKPFDLPYPSADSISDAKRQERLSAILNKWPQLHAVAMGRLSNQRKSDETPKILAWAIKPEIADEIRATRIPGLRILEVSTRNYPEGSLFAHALGFVFLSDLERGQDGLELAANQRLLASKGLNAAVQTTLDPAIQGIARDALKAGISEYGASAGAAVVIDVGTSEIRAMVSAPDFDPNDASSYRNPYQPERILNRAVATSFPIGSLLTPLIVAQEIESGRITPATIISLGNGQLKIGKTIIRDANRFDSLSVSDVVVKSSNVGAAKLSMQLPLLELQSISKNLGLGDPLGIPGILGGVNYERIAWDQWTPAMLASPGMHIETNLLQVTKAYLPIARNGELPSLSLLKNKTIGDPLRVRVLSSETATSIRKMLQDAASPYGTAPKAQVTGVSVAGKTASITESSSISDEGLMTRPATGAFVGMAPAENPRFLIGVMLLFPRESVRFGGETAAPVFAEIVRGVMNQPESPGDSVMRRADDLK